MICDCTSWSHILAVDHTSTDLLVTLNKLFMDCPTYLCLLGDPLRHAPLPSPTSCPCHLFLTLAWAPVAYSNVKLESSAQNDGSVLQKVQLEISLADAHRSNVCSRCITMHRTYNAHTTYVEPLIDFPTWHLYTRVTLIM